jgi:hypothetical protein
MSTIATAQALRDRAIPIPIPDTDLILLCRRPDLLTLITNGWLPLARFGEVIGNTIEQGEIVDPILRAKRIDEDVRTDLLTYQDFVDRWACAAITAPTVVLTQEEVDADPTRLLVADLDFAVKMQVLIQTSASLRSRGVKDAVAEFRTRVAPAAAAGPVSATVPDAAVSTAAN